MPNESDLQNLSAMPAAGRLLAIDPGTKKIGVAVSDETRTIARPLPIIKRESWKKLVLKLAGIVAEYDAKALVVGLPLNFDGSESEMSAEARKMARNLSLSLPIPVFLQDERATTYEARGNLWKQEISADKIAKLLDSEAAAIILTDFLDRLGG
jgi:putative holliday junction resolvase